MGKIIRDGEMYGTGETATEERDGLMSAADKKELASVSETLESQSLLNKKQALDPGANLDDCTETGIYYTNGVDILNDGVANWGFLFVLNHNNTIVQFFFGTSHQIYTRSHAGNPLEWNDWNKATTSIA